MLPEGPDFGVVDLEFVHGHRPWRPESEGGRTGHLRADHTLSGRPVTPGPEKEFRSKRLVESGVPMDLLLHRF